MGYFSNKDNNDKSKIVLALSWRDIKAPKMGGAEVLSHGIYKNLVRDGIELVHLSPMFPGAQEEEYIDGVRYIRRGNILTVLLYAFIYYVKNRNMITTVIDQCNTHRFFTPFYVPANKRVLFIHQLTREIWDINAPKPLSTIGKKLEDHWLKIYRKGRCITVSESTRDDLVELGFSSDRIFIMPNWIDRNVLTIQSRNYPKNSDPTFIYVGRYSAYKGLDICIEAFSMIKKDYPKAQLWIVGKKDESYVRGTLLKICEQNGISIRDISENEDDAKIGLGLSDKSDIILWGFLSEDEKYELMARSKLLLFPSIREGWGIIVTEAGILNTPSLVMDAPGMRDAVDKGRAGYMCDERASAAFAHIMTNILSNDKKYEDMCLAARTYSMNYLEGSSLIEEKLTELESFIR